MIRSVTTKCLPVLFLMACLAPALHVAPAQAESPLPDVLKLAPKDAQVVIVVPNIQTLRKKFDTFAESLGLKNMPGYVNPVDEIKRELNVGDGFNENGSALIVMSKLENAIENGEDPLVTVAVPVSNYDKFIAPYKPTKEGDLHVFDAGGETVYTRKSGKHCIMSPTKSLVADFKPGNNTDAIAKAAGTLGKRYLASSDVSIYVNVESLAPILRQKLDEGYRDMADLFDAFGQGDDAQAQMMKTSKAMASMFIEGLDSMLRDTTVAVLAGDMDSKGIGMTFTAQFREGSQLAKIFPGGGNASNLLAKLPGDPYMFAGAMDFNGINLAKIADTMAKQMPKDGGWIADMMKQSLPLMAKAKGMAMVYPVPQNPAGILGGFGGISLVETDDPDGYLKLNQKYVKSMNSLKMDLGPDAEGKPMQLTFASKYDANVFEIDGVSVDQYQIKMNMPPELLRQMGPMAGVMMGMGMTNQTGYVAKKGKYVLMTTLADTNMVKAGLKALSDGKGLGAEGPTAKTRKVGLPGKTAGEFYISVGGIIKTVQPFIAMMAPNGPQIQVPENLPPIAMGLSAQDSGMAVRFYAPMPLITWIKDFAMQMQAGGGQGGDAPPAPF